MKKQERLCGIYKIENKINSKVYIGQSNNIYKRWYAHKNDLRRNVHDNDYLQHAWNKYGEENFEFSIVELCENNIDVLNSREQFYIDKFNVIDRNLGYNIKPKADNSIVDEYTKSKISNTLKGQYKGETTPSCQHSETTIKNIINDLMNPALSYVEIANKNSVETYIVHSVYYKKSWCYLTENISFPKRSKPTFSKLSEKDVENIIDLFYKGLTDNEIAEVYGVSSSSIYAIRSGLSWKHITNKYKDIPRTHQKNPTTLSEEKVKEIKQDLKAGNYSTYRELASRYGITPQILYGIRTNKYYKNIA